MRILEKVEIAGAICVIYSREYGIQKSENCILFTFKILQAILFMKGGKWGVLDVKSIWKDKLLNNVRFF